ncbi:MAG: hypothetical protein GWN61_22410 [candidate division Zixibacteria bacterium]|nr:hypothetical protein [candidate division Zixibacteria bacterium]NIW49374.1 hypothetical protein [Gammaproteobacteria bacterium]NIR67235.1 hypothetical protein [candidate division Zixibacteria bacterium]NIS48617.1 hypothetical protein [candidate division Zixibacteria bacterium]NIU16684.1 hypothetical protein [candidate division Zixibacteria bacterium]
MIEITDAHINRLIQLESGITYAADKDDGRPNYRVIDSPSKVLLSAPHGAQTFRNNRYEKWHSEDGYTAGMCLLLAELSSVSAIATTFPNFEYDPNYSRFDVPYKIALKDLVEKNGIRYVLDIHGASFHSVKMDQADKIDLGYRSSRNDADRSMRKKHIDEFISILENIAGERYTLDFQVSHNKFAARRCYTITSFVHNLSVTRSNPDVQALQIEMKPHLRIASNQNYRMSIKTMLQAFVNFLDYLEHTA